MSNQTSDLLNTKLFKYLFIIYKYVLEQYGYLKKKHKNIQQTVVLDNSNICVNTVTYVVYVHENLVYDECISSHS